MKRWKSVAWKMSILLGGIGALIVLYANMSEESRRPNTAMQTTFPTMGTIRDVIVSKGTVAYDRQVTIRAQSSGFVNSMRVKDGTRVKQGQELVHVNDPVAEIDMSLLLAETVQLKKNLDAAEQEVDASQRLFDKGGSSRQELQKKTLERDLAATDLKRKTLELKRLQTIKAQSRFTSPVDGLVLTMHADNGQHVNAGEELLTLSGGGGRNVVTFIDAMDVERIQIGQEAVFSEQEESSLRWRGKVRSIGESIANTQKPNAVKVVIEPLDPAQELRVSQQLYVEHVLIEQQEVMRIPREFVNQRDGQTFVYVLTDDGTEQRSIQTGPGDLSFVQIVSGLTLRDELVRNPLQNKIKP